MKVLCWGDSDMFYDKVVHLVTYDIVAIFKVYLLQSFQHRKTIRRAELSDCHLLIL
jgi:hypothetical protein